MKRLVFRIAIGVGLVLSLLSGLARLGQLYWLFDVLSHFYLHYTLGLLFCCSVVLFVKQKRPFLLLLPALALDLFLLAPFLLPQPARAGVNPLKIIAFNVFADNRAYDAITAYLRLEAADVVFLSEVRPELLAVLADDLAELYPYSYGEASRGTLGLVFLSRTPFASTEVLPVLEGRRRRVLKVAVDWHGTPVNLYGLHPLPPLGPSWARGRDQELSAVAALVAEANRPVVVLGDFNASPWSYTMRGFTRAGVTNVARGFGIRPTWRYGAGLLAGLSAAPLDHILVSAGGQAISYRVGSRAGSDHNAVIAELELN